jgi:hypothetical protein
MISLSLARARSLPPSFSTFLWNDLSLFLSLRLLLNSVSLVLSIPLYLSLSHSIPPSFSLSIYPSFFLSLSLYLPLSRSIPPSFSLSLSRSIPPSFSLYLSFSLSFYPFLFISLKLTQNQSIDLKCCIILRGCVIKFPKFPTQLIFWNLFFIFLAHFASPGANRTKIWNKSTHSFLSQTVSLIINYFSVAINWSRLLKEWDNSLHRSLIRIKAFNCY